MKRAALVSALFLSGAGVLEIAADEPPIPPPASPPLSALVPWQPPGLSSPSLLPPQASHRPSPVAFTPLKIPAATITNQGSLTSVLPLFRNIEVTKRGSLFDTPTPRVYKSFPYTMIVVVPGRIPDDTMIKPDSSTNRFPMPVIRPELKLIPIEKR